MPIVELVFYFFGSVLTLSALGVITSRNPIYSVLLLILSFFSAACIWLLLEVEFLAIVLVVVYVGAVMVLFLFVVMMLDINLVVLRQGFARYLPAGLLVAFAMGSQLLILIWATGIGEQAIPSPRPEGYSHTGAIGEALFTEYLYPFELAGLILLVAMVAAIVLTLRKRAQIKSQDPSEQVRARPKERMRLVKMDAEKEEG